MASSRVTLWLLAKPTTKDVGLKLWGQGIFKPYDDFAQQTLLGEAGEEISVHALMQSLGAVDPEGIISTLWTIMLVQPLADLLFSGNLPEVVLLGRWRGVSSILPEWPDRRWLTITAQQDSIPETVAARVGTDFDLWLVKPVVVIECTFRRAHPFNLDVSRAALTALFAPCFALHCAWMRTQSLP